MGLLYDSSLMADDDPYELLEDGEPTGIVELPPEWIRDDAVYFNIVPLQRAAALHAALRRWRRSSRPSSTAPMREGGMFLLTMHPHIIGHRSRMPCWSG